MSSEQSPSVDPTPPPTPAPAPARARGRWRRPQIGSTWAALAVALFLTAFGNLQLWGALSSGPAQVSWLARLAGFLVVLAVLDLVLQLIALPWLFKPVAVIALLAASLASFAGLCYGVLIDASMIRNAVETDVAEASELVTLRGLACVLLLGLLPTALLLWTQVRYGPIGRQLKLRAAVIVLSFAAALGTAPFVSQELTFTVRSHPELKHMVNPTTPIAAVVFYIRSHFHMGESVLEQIGLDATRTPVSAGGAADASGAPGDAQRERLVFIFVLGETARASHFSLNGYERETNPELKARHVINFPDVTACATSTAEALPCLFSGLPRDECLDRDASERENLLDVLQRVGVGVLWKDNNSGCKGVCARVPFEIATGPPELHNGDQPFDETLLIGLQEHLARQSGDLFIVLHQQGSHGPAYFRRSPAAFKRFLPECAGEDVQLCPREEVVNAYDNTILYTDHVLAMVIDFLASQGESSQVAMLYVSDHGESLGENGIYLHGFPYWLAPKDQIHVPMVFWASPEFYVARGLSPERLRGASGLAYSHDNLFHTILGVFGVQTSLYDSQQDIFGNAR